MVRKVTFIRFIRFGSYVIAISSFNTGDMGNQKRSRVKNTSPKNKLGVNEQENVQELHPLLINLVRIVKSYLI